MKEPLVARMSHVSHAQEVYNAENKINVVHTCKSRENYDIYIVISNYWNGYYAYVDIRDMDILLEQSEEVFDEFELFFPLRIDVSLMYGYGCYFNAQSTIEHMTEQMLDVSRKTAELKNRLIQY